MNLTEHFTLSELIASDTALRLGIQNVPVDPRVTGNLHVLARGLERVRRALGDRPIFITSGYRSPDLNVAVRGSLNSAHLRGLAADIKVQGMAAREVCQAIANHADMIGFHQLIHEGTWTHIAFTDDGDPAGAILTAHFRPGRPTTYTKGLA